jgi:tetratricopeptide (TPR) repeat protein
MRFFTSMTFIALLATAGLSLADEAALSQVPQISEQPGTGDLTELDSKARLDSLFTRLKRESDPEAAKGLVGDIRGLLTESGSPTVDLLMGRAAEAIASDRKSAAFDYLDQVIVLRPDYAEGWNLRATLHYALGNNRKSMSDISHVLALEPRHLGALSGLAGILATEGRDEAALRVWESYLKLYPTDRGAQDQARDLLEKLAGSRT